MQIDKESKSNYITTLEINRDFSTFFSLLNQEIITQNNYSDKLAKKYSDNKKLMYLIFWSCLESNREDLISNLERSYTFYYKNNKSISLRNLKSSELMNGYAYEVALEYEFNDSNIIFILKKGKISVDLEYIDLLLEEKRFSTIEEIYKAGNFCFISKTKSLYYYFEQLASDMSSNSNSIKLNTVINSPKRNKNTSPSNINNRNNQTERTYRTALTQSSSNRETIENNNKTNNGEKRENIDILNLIRKEKSRLSLVILICLLAYRNPSKKENNSSLENFIKNLSNEFKATKTSKIYDSSNKQNLLEIDFIKKLRTLVLFDINKKESIQILEALYICNLSYLTTELLEADLLFIDIDLISLILFKGDNKFFTLLLKKYLSLDLNDQNILVSENFNSLLFDYIVIDINNIELYLYCLKETITTFKIKTVKKLLPILDDLCDLEKNSIVKNIITNPIKILVLISEIVNIISNQFPPLRVKTDRILERSINFAEKLQSIVDEENELRELMLEKDLRGRSVLKIISDNNFLSLLKNRLIEKITDDQWNGLYQLEDNDGSFLQSSSMYRSLQVSLNTKDYDVFTNLRNTNKKIYSPNFTQYEVWKKHIFSKYLVDFLFVLFLALHFQVSSLRMLEEYKYLLNTSKNTTVFNGIVLNMTYDKNYRLNQKFDLPGYVNSTQNDNYNDVPLYSSVSSNYNYTFKYNNTDVMNKIQQNLLWYDFNLSESQFSDLNSIINLHDFNDFNKINSNLNNNITEFDFFNVLKEINPSQYRYIENTINDYSKFHKKYERQKYFIDSYYLFFNLFYLFIASYIIRIIFYYKVRKYIMPLTVLPDVCLIILTFLIQFAWKDIDNDYRFSFLKRVNQTQIENLTFPLSNYTQEVIYVKENSPLNREFLFIAFICLFLWIKILILFQGIKNFGPVIVILFQTIKGVAIYIVSFLFLILIIGFLGYYLFFNVNTYISDSPFSTSIYHFVISLGNDPDYKSFLSSPFIEKKLWLKYASGVFIVLIIVINVIIFLNLIIAFLTNIFEKLRSNSLELYIQKKILIREYYYNTNKSYNSLLKAVFPIDLILLPFYLAFLLINDEDTALKYNEFLNLLIYIFFCGAYILIYFITNVFLVLVIYFKIILTKTIQVFLVDKQNYYKLYKIISLLTYILFGLCIQLKCLFFDTYIYSRELFRSNLPKLISTEDSGSIQINRVVAVKLKRLAELLTTFNGINETSVSNTVFLELFSEVNNEIESIWFKKIAFYFRNNREIEYKNSKKDVINYEAIEIDKGNIVKELNKVRVLEEKLRILGLNYFDLKCFISNFEDENNFIDLTRLVLSIDYKIKLDLTYYYFKLVFSGFFNDTVESKINNFINNSYRENRLKIDDNYNTLISSRAEQTDRNLITTTERIRDPQIDKIIIQDNDNYNNDDNNNEYQLPSEINVEKEYDEENKVKIIEETNEENSYKNSYLNVKTNDNVDNIELNSNEKLNNNSNNINYAVTNKSSDKLSVYSEIIATKNSLNDIMKLKTNSNNNTNKKLNTTEPHKDKEIPNLKNIKAKKSTRSQKINKDPFIYLPNLPNEKIEENQSIKQSQLSVSNETVMLDYKDLYNLDQGYNNQEQQNSEITKKSNKNSDKKSDNFNNKNYLFEESVKNNDSDSENSLSDNNKNNNNKISKSQINQSSESNNINDKMNEIANIDTDDISKKKFKIDLESINKNKFNVNKKMIVNEKNNKILNEVDNNTINSVTNKTNNAINSTFNASTMTTVLIPEKVIKKEILRFPFIKSALFSRLDINLTQSNVEYNKFDTPSQNNILRFRDIKTLGSSTSVAMRKKFSSKLNTTYKQKNN